jgi:hypothetical protein
VTTLRALHPADVARELGRSVHWLYDNWRHEVAAKRLPPPLHATGPLVWSAAQLYAVLDKPLTREQRALAAAHRAAYDAAIAPASERLARDEIAETRTRLEQEFVRS